jgi:hypothetical protein
MEWISFFEKQPEQGQSIWYYGEALGVWRGTYEFEPNDPFCPYQMVCRERTKETDEILSKYGLDTIEMTADRMDAPWWMPDDGVMSRPIKPAKDYPEDYPNG